MRRWVLEQMLAGETMIGTFVQTPSASVCEVLCACGYDVLVPDAEHAPLSPADIQALVAAADNAGAPALIRIAGHEGSQIQYALDAGAAGIIVPRINTAEEARAVVSRATYPPNGERGSGPGRAALFGLDRSAAVDEARANTLIALQIESADAVKNVDAILDVPGSGMAFVGPNDLSLSLGSPPEEELRAIIDDVLGRARARNLLTGILASTPDLVAHYRAAGVSLILTGTDLGLLAKGAKTCIDALKP